VAPFGRDYAPLENTLTMLLQAKSCTEIEVGEEGFGTIEHATALALVAIGVNLERIKDALETIAREGIGR